MDWLSNGISDALNSTDSNQEDSNSKTFPSPLNMAADSFSFVTPNMPSMSMFSSADALPSSDDAPGISLDGDNVSLSKNDSLDDQKDIPKANSTSKSVSMDPEIDVDESKDNFDGDPTRRLSANEIINSTIGSVQNVLHHTSAMVVDGAVAGARKSSTFGENIVRPGAFHKQKTMVDLTTGTKMKRKKIEHVNLVPEKLRLNLAFSQLAEIKRNKTVGVKYNSATIFTLMWLGYIVGSLLVLAADETSKFCPSYFVFLALRVVILLPSSILAYCWKRGWWPRSLPSPEVIGLCIATYIVVIISIGFTTVLNGTCGVRVPIVEGTLDVTLTGSDNVFYLRKEVCEIYNADFTQVEDDCNASLEDRHTYFELNVSFWTGQLVLVLFGFTSLFKPSFKTTVFYTAIVWFVAALGCWYQGFGFWSDQDRVFNSGVFTAIFSLTCAAAVNIYSAHVMHDLELRLVISSHQLSDDRFMAPKGDKVVYVKANVCGASELTIDTGGHMDMAVSMVNEVIQSLGKEYFGTQLTLDDEIKLLMNSGKVLTDKEKAHIRELMESGKRNDCDFLFSFHDVFDAVSFALTLQNELMDIDWNDQILKAPCGHARTEGVMITSMEPESRARAMTVASFKKEKTGKNAIDDLNLTAFHGLRVQMGVHMGSDVGGIKGSTCSFAEALADISTGGMILLSPDVADILAGALDQLSNSLGKSEQKNVPRLVHMGGLVFPSSNIYHEANNELLRDNALSSNTASNSASTAKKAAHSPKPPSHSPKPVDASDIELGPILSSDGRILEATPSDAPVDIFHIFNEPLFGRHLKWDDTNFELANAVVHSVGYYDAPVKRENRPEFAVVLFGDVMGAHDLQSQSGATFTAAMAEVNQIMSELLVKHRGYQVPQREGHYMHTFSSPKDAVLYHTALQKALLKANWPESYKTNPLTKKIYDPSVAQENVNDDKDLLYNGPTVSLGMSVGVISKSLERSRANYLGPTCNRSARVCGLARNGQLLMCQSEYEGPSLEYVRDGADGTMNKVGAKVMLENQILKGIKGTHSIVYLETDELTLKRRDFPRPK